MQAEDSSGSGVDDTNNRLEQAEALLKHSPGGWVLTTAFRERYPSAPKRPRGRPRKLALVPSTASWGSTAVCDTL